MCGEERQQGPGQSQREQLSIDYRWEAENTLKTKHLIINKELSKSYSDTNDTSKGLFHL